MTTFSAAPTSNISPARPPGCRLSVAASVTEARKYIPWCAITPHSMGDWREPSADDKRVRATRSPDDGALDATGAYEDEDALVLYDTENPLAWVQATDAVELDEIR